MYSLALIDADPIRAFDLYIRLEDEGFNVIGPISSTREGFDCLKNEALDGIMIHAESARNYVPELYNVVMESNIPIIFIGPENGTANRRRDNSFIFPPNAPLKEVKKYLAAQDPSALEKTFMIPASGQGQGLQS